MRQEAQAVEVQRKGSRLGKLHLTDRSSRRAPSGARLSGRSVSWSYPIRNLALGASHNRQRNDAPTLNKY